MSTYTITLTAEQDAALATLIQRTNATRAAANPPLPAITTAQYVQSRMSEVAESYRLQLAGEDEAALIAAYKSANATKKSSIKSTLGI